jgi:MFS family permease
MNQQSEPTKYRPLQETFLEESFESRRRRMLAGALYGFLGGTAFALLSGTIDALAHPDLPMYINWSTVLFTWAWLGLGLAFFGALTGWFTETLQGIAIGAVAMSMVVLVVNLAQSSVRGAITLVMFAVMALPIAAACVPIVWALRWLAERHVNTLAKEGEHRVRGVVILVAIALAIGALPAIFMRMSNPAERSVRTVNSWLQQAAAGQVNETRGLPLKGMPTLNSHIGMGYRLSQRSSQISAQGFDIAIIFNDGYKVTCVLVAFNGQDPYLRGCVEGDIKIPKR